MMIKSDYANWIIPGRLMCGPYPYCDGINFNEETGKVNIDNILADGVDVFVCLCKEINTENHPYFPNYKYYKDYISTLTLEKPITYLHYPIDDGGVPTIKDLIKQIEELKRLLDSGRNIYIHCAGGHGRTNIYTSILVSIFYNTTPELALEYVFNERSKRRVRDRKLEIYNIPKDDRHIIFNKTQEEIVKGVSYYFLICKELE